MTPSNWSTSDPLGEVIVHAAVDGARGAVARGYRPCRDRNVKRLRFVDSLRIRPFREQFLTFTESGSTGCRTVGGRT